MQLLLNEGGIEQRASCEPSVCEVNRDALARAQADSRRANVRRSVTSGSIIRPHDMRCTSPRLAAMASFSDHVARRPTEVVENIPSIYHHSAECQGYTLCAVQALTEQDQIHDQDPKPSPILI